LIVNGETIKRWSLPHDEQHQGKWQEFRYPLKIEEPCWIAARAHSLSPTGRPDAEAHTNPVYVNVDRNEPFNQDDLEWLLGRLEERLSALRQREFPHKNKALEYFEHARKTLQNLQPRD